MNSMKPKFNTAPIDSQIQHHPVMGISEWMCYYTNYNKPCSGPEVIDQCIDLHQHWGINHMVWNCGRSVVDYWSDLPNATMQCVDSHLVGGQDWSFVTKIMEKICPLRQAISLCRDRNMPILGRLGMNRHYGSADYAGVTSRFAYDNLHLHEKTKLGNPVPHRLCYATEEVQQERIDILLEIQRIGVDGLVLDFCRQIPILMYHPALVDPFIAKHSADPRKIQSRNPDDFQQWFQYRADVLTGFMQKLRQAVQEQEKMLGYACPIITRVPDNAPWLMIAFGLDIERWCAKDLIDGLMLSPFPLCRDDPGHYHAYHVEVAHRHNKICIGGIGSKKLIESGTQQNTGFFDPQPVYNWAKKQYQAGVDAISLYQSETLVRMDYLKETLTAIGDQKLVAQRAKSMPEPDFPSDYTICMDWHTNVPGQHSIDVSQVGDGAL